MLEFTGDQKTFLYQCIILHIYFHVVQKRKKYTIDLFFANIIFYYSHVPIMSACIVVRIFCW